MMLDVWPVVTREAIVSAYRRLPTGDGEARFRTLRKSELVTAGRRLEPREGRRLKGSVTLFSSLNVDAARLARHGYRDEAAKVARLAAEVEDSPDWSLLLQMVTDGMAAAGSHDQADQTAGQVVEPGDSAGPSGSYDRSSDAVDSQRARVLDAVVNGVRLPEPVAYVMRGIARRTQVARQQVADQLQAVGSATVGAITSVSDEVAVLRTSDGSEYAIPRTMAHGARRDEVGALVTLIFERVSDTASVFEVAPAFDLEIKVGRSAQTLARAMAKSYQLGRHTDVPRVQYWLTSPIGVGSWSHVDLNGPITSHAPQPEAASDAREAGAQSGPDLPYSPFGRRDRRTVALTREDVEVLSRRPAGGRDYHRGPRVLVPVRIEG